MIERIHNPLPESCLSKEEVLLAEDVELRVTIEDTGGDELIEDTDDKGRKDGEKHIVQRERPGLERDLAGEVIEERELQENKLSREFRKSVKHEPRIVSCKE